MDKAMKGEIEMDNERQEKGIIAFYDNPIDLLRFLRDVSKFNKDADFNDDKVWQNEFKFVYDEINDFLNRRRTK